MIQADELTKKFDDFIAVDRVSFNVPAGEVLVILGPNGAGKTTTVRMLTSILRPTSGKASIAGYDVLTQPDRVRSVVGVLTENHGLYGRMTAMEYLDFFGSLYGLDPVKARLRAEELLEQFGLKVTRKQRLGEFSKGMRQKLALVRAMLHNPPVLLLDEPTSAMDPESAQIVREVIRGLRSSQRAIILCTHNLLEAESLADRIAIIRTGRLILNGTSEALKRSLMGGPEYEIKFSGSLDGAHIELPGGAEITSRGRDWMRFRPVDPITTNPQVFKYLVQIGLGVISVQEVARSLETVYIQAIRQSSNPEMDRVSGV